MAVEGEEKKAFLKQRLLKEAARITLNDSVVWSVW